MFFKYNTYYKHSLPKINWKILFAPSILIFREGFIKNNWENFPLDGISHFFMNPSLTANLGFMIVSHLYVNIDVYWNMIIEMISRYKNNSIFKKFYRFQTFYCPLP